LILHLLDYWFPSTGIANLFSYITFRTFSAALLTFAFVLFFMPRFIRWVQSVQWRQVVRDDGPQTHLKKKGTPTMGGLVMLLAILVISFCFMRLDRWEPWICLGAFLAAGILGFLDDYLKLSKKNPKGLSSSAKMIGLLLISVAVVGMIRNLELVESSIYFPFLKNFVLPIGVFFYLWGYLVIAGAANAVNLTDGLDGLAIVPIMTTAGVILILAYVSGHKSLAEYLHFVHVVGAGEMSVIMGAVIGAGLGFLWFNAHPAEVFMGDVGSLSLGTLLAVAALLVHQEFILLVAGFLFVLEALSVIIQVAFYKRTKRRVFRMAPLHHHFELSGWPEPKVIVRFWILSLIFAVVALSSLKLR
jgi:phospho-N-acetylmuramoyl-pentapeptide-transferase